MTHKIGNYQVPFDENGNQLDYYEKRTWKPQKLVVDDKLCCYFPKQVFL